MAFGRFARRGGDRAISAGHPGAEGCAVPYRARASAGSARAGTTPPEPARGRLNWSIGAAGL